jgi:hypothetical protein
VRHALHHALLATLALVGGGAGLAGVACGTASKQTLPPLDSISVPDAANSTDVKPTGGRNLGTIPPSTVSATQVGAPTTTSPFDTSGPPCTFDVIHAAVGPAPAGITDVDLRCVGSWASWVGKADDPTKFDGYFAVARRTASGWKTVNLGTAGVCADGGVPAELWTALNCTE